MFIMSLPLALTRGAWVGIAVTCGFSSSAAKSTTVGSLLVAANVDAGAPGVGLAATVAAIVGVSTTATAVCVGGSLVVGTMVGSVVGIGLGVFVAMACTEGR